MSKRNGLTYALLAMVVVIAGCANLQSAEHKYLMRGQIVEVDNNRAYVCVGSADGARVGQNVKVQHASRQTGSSKQVPAYRLETTGRAEITEIVNEHFAWATLTSGTMLAYDQIELDQP